MLRDRGIPRRVHWMGKHIMPPVIKCSIVTPQPSAMVLQDWLFPLVLPYLGESLPPSVCAEWHQFVSERQLAAVSYLTRAQWRWLEVRKQAAIEGTLSESIVHLVELVSSSRLNLNICCGEWAFGDQRFRHMRGLAAWLWNIVPPQYLGALVIGGGVDNISKFACTVCLHDLLHAKSLDLTSTKLGVDGLVVLSQFIAHRRGLQLYASFNQSTASSAPASKSSSTEPPPPLLSLRLGENPLVGLGACW